MDRQFYIGTSRIVTRTTDAERLCSNCKEPISKGDSYLFVSKRVSIRGKMFFRYDSIHMDCVGPWHYKLLQKRVDLGPVDTTPRSGHKGRAKTYSNPEERQARMKVLDRIHFLQRRVLQVKDRVPFAYYFLQLQAAINMAKKLDPPWTPIMSAWDEYQTKIQLRMKEFHFDMAPQGFAVEMYEISKDYVPAPGRPATKVRAEPTGRQNFRRPTQFDPWAP